MKRTTTVEAYDMGPPKDVQFIKAVRDAHKAMLDAAREFADDPESAYGARQLGVVNDRHEWLFELFDDGPFSHHDMDRLRRSSELFTHRHNALRRGEMDVTYGFGRRVEHHLDRLEARVGEWEQIYEYASEDSDNE